MPWAGDITATCEKLRYDKLYLSEAGSNSSKIYLTPHLIVDSHVPSDGVTFSYMHAWLADEKSAEAVLVHLLGTSPETVLLEFPTFSDYGPFRHDSAYKRCATALCSHLQLVQSSTTLGIATIQETSLLKFW